MKKFLSLVLALVMTMSLVTISAGAQDFTDDDSITYKEAVDVISAIGVVDGYTDESFRPTQVLTRGAAAKIICNLILGPTTASYLSADTAPFRDVPVTNTFAGYIAYCSQQGIINGYSDGTFRPTGTLSGNAFMKMLLGALGYDSSVEGYTGANWTINVIKQAAGIGLDDGNDEFVGSKAVTREEACLYAFNMLQATMVQYDAKTTVDVNGATVTIAGDVAKEVAQGGYDNTMNAPYLQFAERYFDKLTKRADTDDFARPATTWVHDGDKIGTYVDDADVSYTSNVTLGTIYSDLGLTQADRNAEVYYNGVQATDVAVTRNNAVKISSTTANDKLVGDGTIVDVYYDSDNNDVTICVVDVYAGEIVSINTSAADPYVVVNPLSNMTNKDLGTVNPSGTQRRFETTDSFNEDQIVLFTYSQSANEIKSVVPAEYVEGTVAEYVSGKNLTVGETKYSYAKNIAYAFVNESDMQTKGDYVVYLDANGLVVFVDEQEFNSSDYAFVLNAQTSGSAAFGRDQAKIVTATGKLMTVDTDDDYTDLVGKIVTYREDNNGDYALRVAPNSYQNGASISTNYKTNGSTKDADGVFAGGSTQFALKNSQAEITIGSNSYNDANGVAISGGVSGAVTPTLDKVYANSETVFVVAETDPTGSHETTYSAYVGVRNAPNITAASGKPVEAFYYVRGNNLLAFMFIDVGQATITGGSNDVVFLAGKEGMTGHVYANDGSDYYLYNAVVGGEITTVRVAASVAESGFDGGDKKNVVFQNPDYNNKNIVTDFDAIGSGYSVVANGTTGIWKLSGAYTIGIGGSRASQSTRYTVASDAKMFYIDLDGVITKIAEVSDIASDADAEVIALMSTTDGDIEYLFIQEVDTNNQDNATDDTPGVVSNVNYNSTSGTVTVTASKAGNYTVRVQVLSAGEYVTAATYTAVVATDGGTSAPVTVGKLTAGNARITCGDVTILA